MKNLKNFLNVRYKNAWAIVAGGEIFAPLFETRKEAREKWEKENRQGQIRKIEVIIK